MPHSRESRGDPGPGLRPQPARDRGAGRGGGTSAGCPIVRPQASDGPARARAHARAGDRSPGNTDRDHHRRVTRTRAIDQRPTVDAATHRETTSPERYRVQFTIGKEGHDRLRRLQDLLRREIPGGDPGAIVERALTLLLEKVEKAKFAATAKPRRTRPIRPGTDKVGERALGRDIPSHVQRAAWRRDGGQCGFVGKNGHRCTERTFLEFHHIVPYALGGLATVENISLRCRRHNQYESELVFGPHGTSEVREARGSWLPARNVMSAQVSGRSG